MELGIGPHLEETELEQYAMGTLPESRIKSFEEHLLACETCQNQLLEMEAYVNAVRSVSPKLRNVRLSGWNSPTTRVVMRCMLVTATIAAGVIAARFWTPAPPAKSGLALVMLEATRGIEGAASPTAPAGQPLSLGIDLKELASSPSYRLEIVHAGGATLEDSRVTPQGGTITRNLNSGLRAGRYYVRLYAATGELLREYGLQVR